MSKNVTELNEYEQQLLDGWEEVYKRGQLTLWMLLALHDGPKHMAAIKQYVEAETNGMLTADDQSMYRALRRYADMEMIRFTMEVRASIADRKIYELTATGRHVLQRFVQRNIRQLITQKDIAKILEGTK